MRRRVLSLTVAAAAAVVAAGLPARAVATLDFTPFEIGRFQEQIVDAAARRDASVVLIVTQPDWCPPCIALDRKWLKNPDERDLARRLRGEVVTEVRGYEPDGAAVLAEQGVRFVGTPTTFVFGDVRHGQPLSRARLEGAIVGAPEDFPRQLTALVEAAGSRATAPDADGLDPALGGGEDAQPAARASAWLDTAEQRNDLGDAAGAREAIGRARAIASETGDQRDEILRRAARLEITTVLRVEKDDARALELIDRHLAEHPTTADALAYDRAWALGRLGRADEVLTLADERWLSEEAGVAGVKTFAYLAFRLEDEALLGRAERVVRAALREHPDEAASLSSALARVLRRQGRLLEAEAHFERAVELAATDDARRTAEGQLEHLRKEMSAAYQPPERKPLSIQFVGYEPGGGPFGPGLTFALFVLPVALLMLAAFLALLQWPAGERDAA